MNQEYMDKGFFLPKDFYSDKEIENIYPVIRKFHEAWEIENKEFYDEKAVNSSYITGSKTLDEEDRLILFKFIASFKLAQVYKELPIKKACFMNTQLFFNPVNEKQENYWHRDPQYILTEEEQKIALNGPEVIHFRIALEDEPGLELIPGTHKRWDSEDELNVRLEKSGRKNSESLSNGMKIPLDKGDLLVFSANMIHRGLYGKNRLAFDILFCEADPELMKYVEPSCLPSSKQLSSFEYPVIFQNSIEMKTSKN